MRIRESPESRNFRDPVLGVAGQLGFVSDSMSESELKAVRSLFKTVVLGIQYGLGVRSLAVRTGISLCEAAEILARLRARFRVFEAYARSVVERAGLLLEVSTPYGWTMQCPSGIVICGWNFRRRRKFRPPGERPGTVVLNVEGFFA